MTIDFNGHVEGNCLNFKDKGTILSEILSNEENLNEFSSFINTKPNITALNLADCNIDIEQIKLLIAPINNSHITDLDVSDNNITDVGATAIVDMPNLTHLYIHSNNITNEGATAIADMPNLTRLDIDSNNITDEGAIAIANKLSKLIHLNIDGNNITDEGAIAIANKLSKLIHLNIRNTNITDVGATAIATMLNLTYLDIAYHKITDVGATAIATMPNLTYLDIGNTNITDVGATAIADMPNLTHLDVSDNEITAEGATAIANKLFNLTYLDIRYNRITDVGATAIADMPNLTYLDIRCNEITNEGAIAIANKLSKLIHLSINGDNITDEGVIAIVNKLSNLTSLNIFSNNITTEGLAAIAKALKDNDNTTLISLGTLATIDDIEKILEHNKKIKDISEAFKAIISKITLNTDGTPLLSLDKEDSEQNSCLNKLKGYSEKYVTLFLPVLEQSVVQSLHQNTVHVYKDGTEQLSFTARSDALTKVTQTILEHLGFEEKDINEFNSKIAEIIDEVKEMFWLELDILISRDPEMINVRTNKSKFLCYHETMDELQNNQQLTNLYNQCPDLKMPGTILQKFLKDVINGESDIYHNIATQLKQHADAQTFKHKHLIQKLLNNFKVEFDKISEIDILQESSLASEQTASLETILKQYFDTHLSNISEHTQSDLATGESMTSVLGDSSHHID